MLTELDGREKAVSGLEGGQALTAKPEDPSSIHGPM